MMLNNHATSSSTSHPDYNTPPNSNDREMINRQFFRTSFRYDDDDDDGNVPKKMMMMNPRKKRTKMIRVDNASTTTASTCTNLVVAAKKAKYSKKPDPSAPKITRPCTECGRRFWSVKALFGHMRCHPERQWRGINPPPNLRRSSTIDHHHISSDDNVLSMSEEDQQVISCLLMLAKSPPPCTTAVSDQCNYPASNSMTTKYTVGFSGSEIRNQNAVFGCGDVDNTYVMGHRAAGPSGVNSFKFECSSCKKVFGSHQALGGHRASHKNVKGCFAINKNVECNTEEDYNSIGGHDHVENSCGDEDKMLMVLGHRCSICLRVFSSGQALGGHKRCHWEKGDEPSSLTLGGPGPYQQFTAEGASGFDLNLPVPLEDDNTSSSSLNSGLSLDLSLGL